MMMMMMMMMMITFLWGINPLNAKDILYTNHINIIVITHRFYMMWLYNKFLGPRLTIEVTW